MLTRLNISNYRCFQNFAMDGLSQVNLLVGKNNSGKTALAEAIHFVTSGGDPTVLAEAANRRGEMIEVDDANRYLPDVTHFFHGHQIEPGSEFSVCADNGFPKITVRLVSLTQDPELFSKDSEGFETRPVMGLQIEGAVGLGSKVSDVGLSDRGGLIFSPRSRFLASQSTPPSMPSSVFVPTEAVSGPRLTQLWRNAILEASQTQVVSAVQLVQKDVVEILYVPSEASSRYVSSIRNYYVKTLNHEKPLPLGSFGDGMRRLMILALALVRAGDGTLLIDEIDTGLHFSVMADMWRAVVTKAIGANTQVFATTHSWDCIEGLSLLCQQEPEFLDKVAVHTIDRSLPRSVAFSGGSISRMVKHSIDPR